VPLPATPVLNRIVKEAGADAGQVAMALERRSGMPVKIGVPAVDNSEMRGIERM